METTTHKTREVTRKDNFMSFSVSEGEQVTIAVNGEIVIGAYVPVDCDLNIYMKRKPAAFQFS